jgi:hypothetical protein
MHLLVVRRFIADDRPLPGCPSRETLRPQGGKWIPFCSVSDLPAYPFARLPTPSG